MKYYLSFLLLLCAFFSSRGQSLDRLYEAYYRTAAQDIVQRKLLLRRIIDKELYRQPERSLKQLDTLVALHAQLNNRDSVQECQYRLRGLIYAQLSDMRAAIQHYKRYFEYLQSINHDIDDDDPYFYLDWGNAYFHSRLYESARRYYEAAQRIFEAQNNYQGIATIYGNYALIAFERDQVGKGIQLLHQVIHIQQKEVRDTFQIAHAEVVLAEYYLTKLQNYTKTQQHAHRCLQLLLTPNMKQQPAFEQFIPNAAKACNYLAQTYFHQNKTDSSFYYLNKGQDLTERYQIPKLRHTLNNTHTDILIQLQRYSEARIINEENLADSLTPSPENSLRFKYAATIAQALGEEKTAKTYEARYYHDRWKYLQQQYGEDLLLASNLLEEERKDRRLQAQSNDLQQERQLRYTLLFIISLIVIGLIGVSILLIRLRRQREQLQQLSGHLQASNATKDLMLAVLGHDLRAPFQVIWNSTGQLQRSVKEGQLSKVNQLSKELNRAGRRAYGLLDGLMQWVSAQESERQAQSKEVSLKKLVEKTVQSLRSLLDVQQVQIKYDVADWRLHTDPDLLQIILRNLLSNAIRYSPFEGNIYLRTVQKEDSCYLEIADEGEGVADSLLGELKLDKDPVAILKKGGGLGLALVQRVSEQLDLGLTVHLREQRGSAFRLHFPAVQYAANSTAVQTDSGSSEQLHLTASNQKLLQPLARALSQHELFESTALLRLLQAQPPLQTAPAEAWLEEMWRAVQEMDEKAFQELLEKVLKKSTQ